MRPSKTLVLLCLFSMLGASPSDFNTKATKQVYLHFVPFCQAKAKGSVYDLKAGALTLYLF
ncbi:hypothetical protein HBZC1_13170 [Helicobacter bizzozeronii CIII-1]|uniref:Uncharacterized protein n=1 Tax=Helicobacter bizzozeronii (strain CIII-1) TaxID=1002804 RepID=F8KTX4_HELBC|nr:hypothetical protein [Helicobacter bizzozeronii]CCB80303.1 hypothetical protein HBZC1_13170 [Helicobacter bizzozeronii CIII-1]